MKKHTLVGLFAIFSVLLCLLVAVGCTADPTLAETTEAAPTDAPTEAPTDPATEVPTDPATEAPTEAPTEPPVVTEPVVTEEPEATRVHYRFWMSKDEAIAAASAGVDARSISVPHSL